MWLDKYLGQFGSRVESKHGHLRVYQYGPIRAYKGTHIVYRDHAEVDDPPVIGQPNMRVFWTLRRDDAHRIKWWPNRYSLVSERFIREWWDKPLLMKDLSVSGGFPTRVGDTHYMIKINDFPKQWWQPLKEIESPIRLFSFLDPFTDVGDKLIYLSNVPIAKNRAAGTERYRQRQP